MNASSPEIQWFIARDGKQYGPVSDIEMRKLVELGHMKPADLVWRPGFAEWRPSAAVFPGLQPGSPSDAPRPQATPPQQPAPVGGPTGGPSGGPAGGPAGPQNVQPQASAAAASTAARVPSAQPSPQAPGPVGAPSAPAPQAAATPQGSAMPAQAPPGARAPSAQPAPGPGAPTAAPAAAPAAGQWPSGMGGRPAAHPSSMAGRMGVSTAAPSAPAPMQGAPLPGPGAGYGSAPAAAPTAAPTGRPTATHPAGHQPGMRPMQPATGPAMPAPAAPGAAMPGSAMPASAPGFQPLPPTSPRTGPTAPVTPTPQAAAGNPLTTTSDFEDEELAPPRRRRGGRMLAIAVVVLSLSAAGGYVLSQGGLAPAMKALSSLKPAAGKPAPAQTATQTPAAPAAAQATAAPTTAPAAPAAATVADADVAAGAAALDGKLQRSAMWTLLKSEFPDWYAGRLKEGGKLVAEKKSDHDVTKYLIEQIVSLRRQNADKALGASTAKLKDIAGAFLTNLKALAAHSTDSCYTFISQGETSAPIVDLLTTQSQNMPIEAQVVSIFQAVAEGGKQRTPHSPPVKSDYDVLAEQLAKIGWSQADLQLFADPKALARSSPDKVCKMVQDWFTAHMAIPDPAVQERLLVETLRPVVSG